MNFKEKFEGYSVREILMLYMSVLLFSILIFIAYKNFVISLNISDNNNLHISKPLNEFVSHSKRISDVELLTYFNNNVEKLNIDLEEMNISAKMTTVKIIGTYQDLMNFLMIISSNFKVIQF